jgi:O-antigen/teichoic acid export membrane protein
MSLIKNSTVIVTGIILANLLAYVFHFYAGRALGVSEYGVFGALLALLTIFSLPAGAISSGITKYSSRFHSEKNYNKIGILRKKVMIFVIIAAAIIFLLMIIFSRFISNYLNIESNIPIIIVGFCLIVSVILPVNRGILQGMKKYKILSINMIIEAFRDRKSVV